ncbi:MAG TPA: hypothetical protein VFZ89_09440 [Solirubrobacteraceae bacterium]
MKRSILLSLVACLLGAFSVGAIGIAATGKKSTTKTTTTSSGPPPTMKEAQAEREAAHDAQLKKVADALSVSLSDLKDALKGVRNDELAADVAANRLTQAQADAIKACAEAPLTCDRSNLPAFGRGHGGPGKRGDRNAFYAAVAKKLGKETADVKKAFEANKPARANGRGGHGHGAPGFGGPGSPGGPPPGP